MLGKLFNALKGGDMKKENLVKFIELGGLAFLGGTAFFMARKNEELKTRFNEVRKDFLSQKNQADLLRDTLKITYEKYMKLKDNLKEHVESMINLQNKEFEGWSEDTKILTDKFPEMDMQFMAPDILIAKLSGLIDAYILNKWSILPSEYKKIKKIELNNGEQLDIYNKNDMKIVLERLLKSEYITLIKHDFILNFYNFYKEKIIINGEIPKEYNHGEIEYLFDFTIKMILEA